MNLQQHEVSSLNPATDKKSKERKRILIKNSFNK